ncbi:16S rRNA (cytosine(1402)-N(4))-methyltransferase RsmH [Candidatus Stoquefichus sp. SB1]|uniref:16S rRNA (cytosine(1402)-N(4))-methyltransferase RsmH n=1 Tax=Candidatus Stoquefichus sp. SB1 TaxID=1658109 RepID=UPI00067E6C16|nr:16S rRNA (cytosine(1402)-N(4))-methyltransferase RsmH [Candidatus Stoquefichus sp. SB1]
MEPKHKRRVRYSGTHPKKFNEKYKELNPDLYPETIEKVIKKGSTPVGMHLSIMVNEILEFLDIKEGQIGLDCTLGYGGHTLKILECLNHTGHMYALDIDPIESVKTKERLFNKGYGEDVLTIKQCNFKDIDYVSREVGLFDFVLADLGVSSMQIDNPVRGFSYKKEGPLDLRLNPQKGIPASQRLQELSRDQLEQLFIENSDEPYAKEIAKNIDSFLKSGHPIQTTTDLYKIIEKSLSFISINDRKEAVKKSAARVFQALRIDVNNEFDVLIEFMEKLPSILKPGGRVAILTFHSGEDRIVKKAFKEMKNLGIYSDVARNVIRPSKEECHINSRAKSTKMRWAIKA